MTYFEGIVEKISTIIFMGPPFSQQEPEEAPSHRQKTAAQCLVRDERGI